MKGTRLGEFEEIVLLVVCVLSPEAYGVAIMERIRKETGRSASIGAVHSALNRLEEKGFLESSMGASTPERGGRRKRLFSVTAYGMEALEHARMLREGLWSQIAPSVGGRS